MGKCIPRWQLFSAGASIFFMNVAKFRWVLLLMAATFLSHSESFAKSRKSAELRLQGVVQACHDGDTCRVSVTGASARTFQKSIAKVRFAGVDTPELKQPYGKDAQRFTEGLLRGKMVSLVCKGKSYDRITCEVYLDGRNINLEIVQAGWGYDLPKYSKGLYKEAEATARAQKIGIWKSSNLTSPHCFRHKTDKRCRVATSFMP